MSTYTRRPHSRIGNYGVLDPALWGGAPAAPQPGGLEWIQAQAFQSTQAQPASMSTPLDLSPVRPGEVYDPLASLVGGDVSSVIGINQPLRTDTSGAPLPRGGVPWAPGVTPTSAQVAQMEGRGETGTDWGAVGGFFSNLVGAIAPVASGIYMQKQQADQQKDMMKMAQRAALQPQMPQQPIIIQGGGKSNTTLFVGLGIAALVVVAAIVLSR